jgi:nifR3 family TIM-barrel protein
MRLFTPLSIGTTRIPGNLFLAPLAGYTDRAFREVCRRYGAAFTYTEMISAEAVARGNEKTVALAARGAGEELLGIQIFLSEAEQAVRALPGLLACEPTLIDINCGCPVPKVVKTGSGAALMEDPDRLRRIVAAITSRCSVPVTVKLRSGWSASRLTYREAAEAAIDGGATALGLHPRTRLQGYSGTADHSLTADLVARSSVPVIASGDLFSARDAARILSETGCAGVMFARGALGNPFVFAAARAVLAAESDRIPPASPTAAEVVETGYRQLLRAVYYKGEARACSEMKKHLSAYSKGLPHGSALRNSLMRCTGLSQFREVLRGYLRELVSDPGGPAGWLDQTSDEC